MGNLVLGYGLLGKEIVNQTGWEYKCKKDGFDLLDVDLEKEIINYIDDKHAGRLGWASPPVIINCIANTDTYSDDKQSHWDVNYGGVAKLVDFCNKFQIKLVHISTSYLYANSVRNASEDDVPVHNNTWYSYTKLLADGYVQLKSNDYLIIRCTHKPKPFPYDGAWIDQVGNFDYVDVITSNIVSLINKGCGGVYNVGTELKSIHGLSIETNKNIIPILKPSMAPGDVSMNLDKQNKEI
jgi:hypothetical protein